MTAYDETAAPPGADAVVAPPPPPPPGRVAAAWHSRVGGLPRTFWVVLAGQFVNRLGGFVTPFLSIYLHEVRGLSLGQVGIVLAVYGVGGIGSQGLGGMMTDRVGRRRTLVTGMLAAAAALAGVGLATSYLALLITGFFAGLALDLYRPAASALIADVVPSVDRPRAYGLWFWTINLGFAGAALLGGVLASAGFGWLFAVDALTCAVFALVLLRFVPETRPEPQPRDPAVLQTSVLSDRLLLAVSGAAVLFACVFFQSFVTLPIVMRDDGLSTAAYGGVMALNGIVIVLVQPLVLPWLTRLDRSTLLAGSQLLVGLGFGLFSVADSWLSYAAILVIWTLGEIGNAAVASALVADLAPPEARGRYQGVYGSSFGVAALVAPLLGTFALAEFGEGALWGGCVVAGVAMAVTQLAIAPAVRARTAGAR